MQIHNRYILFTGLKARQQSKPNLNKGVRSVGHGSGLDYLVERKTSISVPILSHNDGDDAGHQYSENSEQVMS